MAVVSGNSRKLKALRTRAVGLRELARLIGWDASRYQYYEDTYKKPFLPRDLIELIRPHLVGKGDPPITNDEIEALGGPVGERPVQASVPPLVLPMPPPNPIPVPVIPLQPPAGRADIPVWSAVAAGDEQGTMLMTEAPIDWIMRSDRMMGVANPFAFYIVGDSMEHRFMQGDMAVVNPSMPMRSGADCVFISEGDDGHLYGLVKRLVRATPDAWRVRQLNPSKDFELSRRRWSRAYPIAETRHRA